MTPWDVGIIKAAMQFGFGFVMSIVIVLILINVLKWILRQQEINSCRSQEREDKLLGLLTDYKDNLTKLNESILTTSQYQRAEHEVFKNEIKDIKEEMRKIK